MEETVEMASDRIKAEIETRFNRDEENLSDVMVQKNTEHNLPDVYQCKLYFHVVSKKRSISKAGYIHIMYCCFILSSVFTGVFE